MPNDWEIKKCLRLSLAILLAFVGLVGLAALGFDIPVLRQIVGFVFLSFIPGVLILRILRIHNIGVIESLLYSVGLSIAFVMFAGAFANFVLPSIGIPEPISILPVMATLVVSTVILGALAYKRDKGFRAAETDCVIAEAPRNDGGRPKVLWLPYLLLFLLPILAILGAQLVNLYQNNSVLLFFIVVICCVVAMVAFHRLPGNAYPLAIVMVGLSLLLHVTLISGQLSGYDIHGEYYFQHLVAQAGYWDATVPHNLNTALSIVMLNPIYSLLLNMDAIWVFKIVYPLIFCLVPLALFHIFREQIGAREAFLAAFFFMATPMFVGTTTGVRNQIAQFFFALLILLLIDRKLALSHRTALVVIFALSLIVSHYASGYIVLYLVIVAWAIVALIRSGAGRRAWGWLARKFGGLPQMASQRAFPHKVMVTVVCVSLVFAIGWYGGIAQGTALRTILRIGESQQAVITPGPGGFFEPTLREALIGTALGLDFPSASPLGKVFRIFQYLTQLFIVVGFALMIFKPKGFEFKPEFIGLSAGAALILLACIVLPGFSAYLNVTRFYHLTLFLLAPLLVVGGEAVWHGTPGLAGSVSARLRGKAGLARVTSPGSNSSAYLRFLALAILIPYFLFNSGFISEIGGGKQYIPNDTPHSFALSSYWLDMPVFSQQEAEAAGYLSDIMEEDDLVCADEYGRLLLRDRLHPQLGRIPHSGEAPEEAYVFLRNWNVDRQELLIRIRRGVRKE
ncbi:MAG: DUF2206 domain-containing protein, partial [Dehalococcoidia bacterium]